MGKVVIQFDDVDSLVATLVERLYGDDYFYDIKQLNKKEVESINQVLNEYLQHRGGIEYLDMDTLDLTIFTLIEDIVCILNKLCHRMRVMNITYIEPKRLDGFELLDASGSILVDFSE